MKARVWGLAMISSLSVSPELHATILFKDLYTLGTPDGLLSPALNGVYQIGPGGEVAGAAVDSSTYRGHAVVWSAANPTGVDLHPSSGFTQTEAISTNGTQQVGDGFGPSTGDNSHALLWSGTAGSCVDLNPSGFTTSNAYHTTGTQQVGYSSGTTTGNNPHATLWSGTAGSYVDLNPTGLSNSIAYSSSGSQQVGVGAGTVSGNQSHALLWSGTAASYVDLNPISSVSSCAYGANGSQQVGYGEVRVSNASTAPHALLWSGTAASSVDLNPSGYESSYAYGIEGNRQVGAGYGAADPYMSALLWSGTAASYIDLGELLPANFTLSQAYSIYGNTVYGIAMDTDGNNHVVDWTLPSAVASLGDINGDGKVDIADLGALATNYGKSGSNIAGDINGDGVVNIADLGILATHYGYGTTGPQLAFTDAEKTLGLPAIPEPATLALLAHGLPMMRRRGRRV